MSVKYRKILIIGGGVIGVSTLYELASRGVSATLLEARGDVALETSFANGAMLTPSMSEPWNNPGVGGHLAASLLGLNSSMKLHLRQIPDLAFWGLKFLHHSMPEKHRQATRASFNLALYSVQRTKELGDSLNIRFDQSDLGTLKLFEDRSAMERSLAMAEMLGASGLAYRILSADEAVELEPQLAEIGARIAGAIHYPNDRTGDARLFTRELAARAKALGGEIRTGVCVRRLLVENGAICGVETDAGEITADCVILCAGNTSPKLAKTAGVRLSIKPVKGYSVTLRSPPHVASPRIAVIDDAMHAAVVPLGERLRVVGTAEFSGFDRNLAPARVENLMRLVKRLYPKLAGGLDQAALESWTGLRPMSADGLPFIGSTKVSALYANTGHGHLGWTMASGSAALLADLIVGSTPSIDPTPYRVHR